VKMGPNRRDRRPRRSRPGPPRRARRSPDERLARRARAASTEVLPPTCTPSAPREREVGAVVHRDGARPDHGHDAATSARRRPAGFIRTWTTRAPGITPPRAGAVRRPHDRV
jgi:hypothetical protein